MSGPSGRVQAQIFATYDGLTGAQRLFDHVRERAYTGVSYPPGCVDGTLPVVPENNDPNPDLITRNIQDYAKLFSEISRSLTGQAEVVKRQVDIAEPTSGYMLLECLKASAGLNTRINGATKLQVFLDLKMKNSGCTTLKSFLDLFVTTLTELTTQNEVTITEEIKLATLRTALDLGDQRYGTYLVHTYTSQMDYSETSTYMQNVAELLLPTELNKRKQTDDNQKIAMYGNNKYKGKRDFSKVQCHQCQKFGHVKSVCPDGKI